MPSPFPGMNPFLEQPDVWEDFHGRFIVAMAEHLESMVGPNYVVKIEARLYLHELSTDERRYFGKADVGVSSTSSTTENSGVGVIEAPAQLTLPNVSAERYTWIEVRDRQHRGLVTSIELLSPTNKAPGPDRDDYLSKRTLLLAGSAHMVEIDLRRGGTRPGPPEISPCDYYALVSRTNRRPRIDFWPIQIREPLPTIPVPLASPDADAALPLQTLLHQVWDRAGYAKYVYIESPQPPLRAEDQAWALALAEEARRPAD